jgi:hypothetical protein
VLALALQLSLAVPFAPVPEQPLSGTWVSSGTWMQVSGYGDDAGVPLEALLLQLRRDPGQWTDQLTIDAGPCEGVGSWVTFDEDDAGWCWRGQYVNARGEGSGWGPEACFSIDTTAPPRPMGFDAGPSPTRGELTVTAQPVVDARSATDGYFLLVARTPQGPWFSQQGLQHRALPFTTWLGEGTWYVAVEAVDLAGNTSSADGEPLGLRELTVTAAAARPPPAPAWGLAYTNDWGDQLGYQVPWATDAGVAVVTFSVRKADAGEWHHVDTANVDRGWPFRWISTHVIEREGVFFARVAGVSGAEVGPWSPESAPLVVDATEPTTPGVPAVTPLEARAEPLQLRWAPSSDNLAGVELYKVHLTNGTTNAELYLLTPQPSLDAGMLDEGHWTASVRARDRADNWSPYSGPSTTFTVDRTGPVASAPQVEAADAGVLVRFSAPVDALSAVASVELIRESPDGAQLVVSSGPGPFLDQPPVGTWRWRVRGVDRLGNQGAAGPPSSDVVITAVGVVVAPRITAVPTSAGCGELVVPLEATGDAPLAWSLVNGPAGMTLDATTGVLRWRPEGAEPVEVTVAVRNAAGEDRRTFALARACETREPWSFRVGCEAGPGGVLVVLTLALRRRRRAVLR